MSPELHSRGKFMFPFLPVIGAGMRTRKHNANCNGFQNLTWMYLIGCLGMQRTCCWVKSGMKPAQDSGRTLNENNCDEWYIILHLLHLTHNVMQMLVLLPWGTCICSGQRLRVDLNSEQWEAIHGEEGEQTKVSKTYRAIKYHKR